MFSGTGFIIGPCEEKQRESKDQNLKVFLLLNLDFSSLTNWVFPASGALGVLNDNADGCIFYLIFLYFDNI